MSFLRSDIELRDRDLCFIDTETTGPLIGFHELIEVAAIRTSSDGVITRGQWSTRVTPEFPMRATSFAQALNGFSVENWVGAPLSSPSLWQSFADFVTGCVPVCHNPSFDRAFVSLAAAKQGVTELNLDYHWIGVESIAWPLYRMGLLPNLSLADVCRFVGVPPEPAKHGALNGAAACKEVYIRLIGCLSNESTHTSAQRAIR